MPDPTNPDEQVVVRHVGAPRVEPRRTAFNEAHILATTQAICEYRASVRASTARCSSGGTPTACPSRPGSRRSRCSSPTASRCSSTRSTATPRRPPCRTRSSPPTAARPVPGRRRARRRDRRHAVAQPAGRRRVQVQPAARRAGRHRRDVGHRGAGQRADPRRARAGCAACRSTRRSARSAPTTSWVATSTTCPTWSTSTAIREAGVRIGADPLGGASVAYWGEIGKRHGLDLTVVNPRGRPDVAVHDPRLGRQDPDGLLVAVGHGVADRRARTSTTSPPATTPTPTGTASSRRTPA